MKFTYHPTCYLLYADFYTWALFTLMDREIYNNKQSKEETKKKTFLRRREVIYVLSQIIVITKCLLKIRKT